MIICNFFETCFFLNGNRKLLKYQKHTLYICVCVFLILNNFKYIYYCLYLQEINVS